MPPATANPISRPPPQMAQIENPSSFSLREFIVDEDAANIASLLQSIDPAAYINAQREALEAFNVAKAMQLSKQTAAVEQHRRATSTASSSASASASANAKLKITVTPPEPKVATSSASESAKQKAPAISHHDRKPSSSASAQALAARPSAHTQPRLSLSTVASSSASQSYQRSLSKREPESPAPKSSVPMSPPSQPHSSSASASTATHQFSSSSASHQHSSSAYPHQHSSSASASTSTSRAQTSDATASKKRRTERQPSISPNTPSATQIQPQPQQEQQLIVPPKIDSKNSTASVRLVNPPPTPVEPRSRRRSTAKSPTTSKPAAEPRDVFMSTRNCTKCGTPVPSPRSQSLADSANDIIHLLHVTCPKCSTMHCRGCFAVARCNRALVLASSVAPSKSTSPRSPTSAAPSECSGGSNCTVRNCCSAVRAIAIFEALSAFDDTFAAEAGFGIADAKGKNKDKGKGKEHRDAYVRQIVGKEWASGTGERRFEDSFVHTLKVVRAWLQAPERDDKDDDVYMLHATVPRLFASSLLLEVIPVFLNHTNLRDWVQHAESYLAILKLLRQMLMAPMVNIQTPFAAALSQWADAPSLVSLLRTPMQRIETTSGLRRAVWGDGFVRFEDARAAESAHSMCDLIRQLEAQRSPLLALASTAKFEATLLKVNKLCDVIMYLLLLQVVDF